MGIDPKSWAETFVAELTVGGERVPFERVLARHLEDVAKLRSASGLTWRGMASLLVRAGARRADGGVISPDQLRVGFARLTFKASEEKEMIAARAEARLDGPVTRTQRDAPHHARKPKAKTRGSQAPAITRETIGAATLNREDISIDEIAVALERLKKL
jgi:hypothetical protein